MTQNEVILNHLRTGKSITPKEAMDEYGIFRLASRISGLKKAGHQIDSEMVEVPTRNGTAKVKRYWLCPGTE